MAKVCFILVAGLSRNAKHETRNAKREGADFKFDISDFKKGVGVGDFLTLAMRPVLPAVTCTMQATLTTGTLPGKGTGGGGGGGGHGIVANGLYTFGREGLWGDLDLSSFGEFRKQVSFWEQSNGLLEVPRFWEGSGKKVAMLFWQNSMPSSLGWAADIVVTPKPTHTADGKTFTACWSSPAGLYEELVAKLGPFPLMNYWGPMAGMASSKWIVECAREVWRKEGPDLQLVYVPQTDYNLQRRGPGSEEVARDLRGVAELLGPLVKDVRESGGVVVIAGDYEIGAVDTAVLPNVALREAGLLVTRVDEAGKLLMDYEKSLAFAMVDHQVAHVYVQREMREEARRVLAGVTGVERVLESARAIASVGLNHERSGDLVLLARKDAWFVHDWWESEEEKPAWQFSVDIHRKPGYDPRELFFDPVRKCIAQDAGLVKGSHGLVSEDAREWPVLLCDEKIAPEGETMEATAVAGWLKRLLG